MKRVKSKSKRLKEELNIFVLVLLFIFVLVGIKHILSDSDEAMHLLPFLRDFLMGIGILYPIFRINMIIIRSLDSIGFLSDRFLIRIIRNIFLACGMTLITVLIEVFFKLVVFGYISDDFQLNELIEAFIVNLTCILVIEYYLLNIKNKADQLELEKEKNTLLQHQLNLMKEQVNPHFLFNTLNVLSSLIYIDQDKANKYTKELSKLYRYILGFSKELKVPLQKELDFLHSYFYILKLRFNESLQIHWLLKKQNNKAQIVPLSLQILVENAIKHNAFHSSNPLHISIEEDEGGILVSNNRNQLKGNNSTKHGLSYLKILYRQYNLEIKINEETDTFKVYIPYIRQ